MFYTCATRETQKKGLFFEAKRDSRESRLGGQNVAILDSIEGRLGVTFQTPPKMSSKKGLFSGKFGGIIARNSR